MLTLSVIALGVPLGASLRDRVDTEVRSQAKSQAGVLAASSSDPLEHGRFLALRRLSNASGAAVRGRVIIADRDGRIVADSDGPAQAGQDYSSRPEIVAALRGSDFQGTRHSDTLDADILATAVPILRAGRSIGAVRVTQSVEAVNGAVRSSILGVALVGLVVVGVGVIVGALIAARIASPTRRLAEAADEVTSGNLEARAALEGSTEQRSLARSFNQMTSRLSQLLAGQKAFIADASHQLRTPLTGVRLHLEELADPQFSGDRSELAATAMHEVDRLSAIVDELLVLSRAGEAPGPSEAISLSEAADGAAARWTKAAETGGHRIVRTSSGDTSTVQCGRADLDRAIDVLVENAIAYSPQGRPIEVRDHAQALDVLDEGSGFAPGEEEAVFERFYRGRAGRQGPEGTGLGMPIAAELSAQWGGSVVVVNRPEGGARVTLTFPEGVPG